MWKRASAFIFDAIVFCILATGFAFLISSATGYDNYADTLDNRYDYYETEYGVTFNTTEEEYSAMSETERQNYDAAVDAFNQDEEARKAYGMLVNLTLVITSLGLLSAFAVVEIAAPLLLKDGRTLGKKIFGLCVMRIDGVRVSTIQVIIRTLLGKYTIETMAPALLIIMIFLGTLGLVGTAVILGIIILQIYFLVSTQTNSMIHDLLAKTVVVDAQSQMIFETESEMIEYKKKQSAEEAARAEY